MHNTEYIKKFIKPISLNENKTAVVFFPYAGAGAFLSYKFSPYISKSYSLLGVQLPGRENRFNEDFIKNHDDIYRSVAEALTTDYSAYDFIFWGHSLGAYLALGTVKYLENNFNLKMKKLILSGASPPQTLDPARELHKLSDSALIEALRKYGSLPALDQSNDEYLKMFLPLIRSDVYLVDTYPNKNDLKISSNLIVLSGSRDTRAPIHLAPQWSEVTTGTCVFENFDGDHYFILDPTFRDTFMRLIQSP